jgi:hypothetical protein
MPFPANYYFDKVQREARKAKKKAARLAAREATALARKMARMQAEAERIRQGCGTCAKVENVKPSP